MVNFGHNVLYFPKGLDLLRENKFTGWSTYPVEVYGRKGEYLPDYYGFAITSDAGKIDKSRSPIITKPPYVPGGKPPRVYKGVFFDERKWDGSDFFRLFASFIIVTRSVRDAFKRAKISNVRFTPLSEMELHV